ncbi:hypothetical protein POM88_005072 [Heracleum sosnowskyi]|uniref:Uncharacterized protein n=1 Tax=Heracleum sosnowskyi TaxID=360622 RepID=A0AAD8NE36_9APIA|nr:hypothetical protein POM88_005072 [Heracleum sosnowskyi]
MSFDVKFLDQVGPVDLFNLMQAAHCVKINSLMDLTCPKLGDMVKTKAFGQITEEFGIDLEYFQSFGECRMSASRGLQDAFVEGFTERPKVDRILRQREEETFMNRADFEDAKKDGENAEESDDEDEEMVELDLAVFVDRRYKLFDHYVRELKSSTDRVTLSNATDRLQFFIDGGTCGHLDSDVVRRLLQVLETYHKRQNQCEAVNILSHAMFDKCKDVITNDAIPALVKYMFDSYHELGIESVIGLTHLAYSSPDCINFILENHALEDALKIVKETIGIGMRRIIMALTKFLAVVCRNGIPPHKVGLACNILEEILQKNMGVRSHFVFACYVFQYLTYKHHVSIGKKTLHKLIELSCGLAGTKFCIGSTLCSLLEKDESNIKMEAAWAIYNCIYGDRERHVDDYSKGSAHIVPSLLRSQIPSTTPQTTETKFGLTRKLDIMVVRYCVSLPSRAPSALEEEKDDEGFVTKGFFANNVRRDLSAVLSILDIILEGREPSSEIKYFKSSLPQVYFRRLRTTHGCQVLSNYPVLWDPHQRIDFPVMT